MPDTPELSDNKYSTGYTDGLVGANRLKFTFTNECGLDFLDELKGLTFPEEKKLPKLPKTPEMARIEKKYGHDIRIIIKHLYDNGGGSREFVALTFGLTELTVWLWCRRLRVQLVERPIAIIHKD